MSGASWLCTRSLHSLALAFVWEMKANALTFWLRLRSRHCSFLSDHVGISGHAATLKKMIKRFFVWWCQHKLCLLLVWLSYIIGDQAVLPVQIVQCLLKATQTSSFSKQNFTKKPLLLLSGFNTYDGKNKSQNPQKHQAFDYFSSKVHRYSAINPCHMLHFFTHRLKFFVGR